MGIEDWKRAIAYKKKKDAGLPSTPKRVTRKAASKIKKAFKASIEYTKERRKKEKQPKRKYSTVRRKRGRTTEPSKRGRSLTYYATKPASYQKPDPFREYNRPRPRVSYPPLPKRKPAIFQDDDKGRPLIFQESKKPRRKTIWD